MSENPFKWRLRRFIGSRFLRHIADQRRIDKARRRAERARQRARRPHEVHYFHQLDDPYSHLAAQVIPGLVARYEITLLPHLVGKPPEAATPEADMLIAYSRRDAARIAPFYGLDFVDQGRQPSPELQDLAARILAKNHISNISDISAALWAGDQQTLDPFDKSSSEEAGKLIDEGTKLRAKLKHYLGAMFYYEGEWYWGIDRLPYLEKRLEELNAQRVNELSDEAEPSHEVSSFAVARDLRTPTLITRKKGQKLMKLEYFPSLRSPYTYISIEETLDLPKYYPVELILRPVMPMVMRGMKVPVEKGIYIFLDTKREGTKKGLPFGNMMDPVGPPVLRGYSLFVFAQKKGRGGKYLKSFLQAAFAEGIDTYAPRGLRAVVERAGLDWDKARKHLDNEDWHERLEQNRIAMFDSGCWGVPSYRLIGPEGEDDFALWGNDRLWLLKEEIARRAAL